MIQLFITSLVMGLGLATGFKITEINVNKRKSKIMKVIRYLVERNDTTTLANYLASELTTEELILNRDLITPLYEKRGLFRKKRSVPVKDIDWNKLVIIEK